MVTSSLWGLLALIPIGTQPASQPEATDLDALVVEYFRTDDAGDRTRVLDRIRQSPGATVQSVRASMDRASLWNTAEPGMTSFELAGPWGDPVQVHVRVPAGYVAARRYPMILALHGQGGRATEQIAYTARVLGSAAEEFIIAAPDAYKGTWFGATESEAAQPAAILIEMRKRFHLDTDRVYVSGYSMGGHGSFHTAVLYTDWFASAIPLAGTFPTQGIPELDNVLLPNLVGFPMLVVWGELDTWDENEKSTKSGGIAGLNRSLRARLPAMGVTEIEFIELPGVPHVGVAPPRDRVLHFLGMTRNNARREVDHWFRFPVQGRLGWLRQSKFAGEPWEGTQLVIKVPQGEELAAFAQRTVRSKLARINGTIEGQSVTVLMQKLQEVEVLLHEGLIDLAAPITVYRGRKSVYEGTVAPSIATLLETAYADWEFQRPFSVRILVPSRGKVRAGDLGERRDPPAGRTPSTQHDDEDEAREP